MSDMQKFDWDDFIEDDGEERDFVVLEPGDYDFEVHSFERAFHTAKPGGKIPDCNEADITLKISVETGDAYVRDKLYLVKSCEWRISSFFRSIGMKKQGEKVVMDWEGAIGKTGRCKITKMAGTQNPDVFFNNVKSYIAPKAKSVSEENGEDDPWS